MSKLRSKRLLRLVCSLPPSALFCLLPLAAAAEAPPPAAPPSAPVLAPNAAPPEKNFAEKALDTVVAATAGWFEKVKIRGYGQFRYNRFFESNEKLVNLQGDRSIGKGGGFIIRRARVIIFGDVHDHVSIYLQPDFASSIGDQQHVAILRDWYTDIFLDKDKEFRFRVGQSKVPYGFENMQSSQNRAPFDRIRRDQQRRRKTSATSASSSTGRRRRSGSASSTWSTAG